jgi:repressor LexA
MSATDVEILKVVNAIDKLSKKKGYPPTVREIQEAVGHKSTSTTHKFLNMAKRRQMITNDGVARSILLTEHGESWLQS